MELVDACEFDAALMLDPNRSGSKSSGSNFRTGEWSGAAAIGSAAFGVGAGFGFAGTASAVATFEDSFGPATAFVSAGGAGFGGAGSAGFSTFGSGFVVMESAAGIAGIAGDGSV